MRAYGSIGMSVIYTNELRILYAILTVVDSVYKDQKVIVWCANVHVFNRGRMQVDSTRFTSMGQRLKIHFGDRMYTIAFTSYARRNTDGGIRDPLSTLSLEYLLHQRKVGFDLFKFQ